MKKMTILKKLLLLLLVCSMLPIFGGCQPEEETPDRDNKKEETPSPVLMKSKSGEYDLTLDMATFLLWQQEYQAAYYEYYYVSWGLQEDTNGILEAYSGASQYAVATASAATGDRLSERISVMSDDLARMVAGADAAIELGLSYNQIDQDAVAEYGTWMKKLYSVLDYAKRGETYEDFLRETIGEEITAKDIERAAKLVVMSQKYCNCQKLLLDSVPSEEALADFAAHNPANLYEMGIYVYSGADEAFLEKLYAAAGADWETGEAPIAANITRDAFDRLVAEDIVGKYFADALTVAGVSADDANAEEYRTVATEGLLAGRIDLNLYPSADQSANEAYQALRYDNTVSWDELQTTRLTLTPPVSEERATALQKSVYMLGPIYELGAIYDGDAFYNGNTFYDGNASNEYEYVDIGVIINPFNPVIGGGKNFFSVTTTTTYSAADGVRVKVQVGDIFLCDDGMHSYLVKVTAINGKDVTVEYATYTDSTCHAVYRFLRDKQNAAYKNQTLTCPEIFSRQDEWLWEQDSSAAFLREAGDVNAFRAEALYQVIFVERAPMRKDAEEQSVYGGYLLYQNEKEANAALAQLKKLSGFDRWYAFSALTVTTVTGTGENRNETQTSATVDTTLLGSELSERTVRDWFFSEERQAGDVALIKISSGYHLTYFQAKDLLWARKARDRWVEMQWNAHLEALIEAHDYSLDASVLEALG